MPGKNKGIVDGTPTAKKRTATFTGLNLEPATAVHDTTVLVCLSIKGNSHCTGKDLKAIIEHAISSHKKTFFLIGDETHWHNLKNQNIVSEEQELALKKEAIALGTEYLSLNLPVFFDAIKQLRPDLKINKFIADNAEKPISEQMEALNQFAAIHLIPFEIFRWHEWIANNKHQFACKQKEISALYESVPLLQNSLNVATEDYVKSHAKEEKKIGRELLTSRSRGYLKEEAPAIFWIAAALGINFVAYPGKAPRLFEETRNFFITNTDPIEHAEFRIQSEKPETLAKWLEILLKTKSSSTLLASQSLFSTTKALQRSQSYNLEVKSEWVNTQAQLIISPQPKRIPDSFFVADVKTTISLQQPSDDILEEGEEKSDLLSQLVTFVGNVRSKDKASVATLLITCAAELMNRPATPCAEMALAAAATGNFNATASTWS